MKKETLGRASRTPADPGDPENLHRYFIMLPGISEQHGFKEGWFLEVSTNLDHFRIQGGGLDGKPIFWSPDQDQMRNLCEIALADPVQAIATFLGGLPPTDTRH